LWILDTILPVALVAQVIVGFLFNRFYQFLLLFFIDSFRIMPKIYVRILDSIRPENANSKGMPNMINGKPGMIGIIHATIPMAIRRSPIIGSTKRCHMWRLTSAFEGLFA
jgi:hypothetical protein